VERLEIIKSPLVYLSRPPIIFNVVVLPQPEGPKIETNSFFLKAILIPFRAATLVSATLYSLIIFFKINIFSPL